MTIIAIGPRRKKMEHVEMIVEYLTDGSDFQYYDNHGTIIRCKDCALYGTYECNMRHGFMGVKDDDFCSYGEKKRWMTTRSSRS